MTKLRKGDWVQLSTGKSFWLLDPKPEDFDIEDIANGLSKTCRFSGQIKSEIEFYSVAQHCVAISNVLPKEYAFEGLMHDATEFILTDVPSPIKPMFDNYKQIEQLCHEAIAEKLGLPKKISSIVKEADVKMLMTEKRDLLNDSLTPWNNHVEPYNFKITEHWLPNRAKKEFLKRFYELYNGDKK